MPIFEAMPMTEQQERAVELLSRVIDTLADEALANYSGRDEDVLQHARSQAENEVEALLLTLVRVGRRVDLASFFGSNPADD